MEMVNSRYQKAIQQVPTLFSLALPMIFTALLGDASNLSTLFFVGRLNSAKYIGAATLGNMVCNITGYSVMWGMCSALDALMSQAFGAQSYPLVGLYVQRAMVMFTLASLPIAAMWSQTDNVLYYLLGVDSEIAHLACVWAKILTLGLWPNLITEALKRWLQSQNLVWPSVVCTLLGTLANVALNYYSQRVMSPPMGFVGVALAVPLMQWAMLVILVILIIARKVWIAKFGKKSGLVRAAKDKNFNLPEYAPLSLSDEVMPASISDKESGIEMTAVGTSNPQQIETNDPEDNFPMITFSVFDEWLPILKLGMPGAVSLFIEWGSFELAAGVASQLGAVPLAVHGVYMSTCGIIYMIPQAVALATAVLAGNYLGAKQPEDAAAVVEVGLFIGFTYGIVAGSILILCLRPYWGGIFSNSVEVQDLVYETLPIMFVYTVVDSSKCIALNVLRSTGRPTITAIFNAFVCFAVLLPGAWLFGVRLGYGIWGVWGAMSLAWLVATICFCVIVFRTDWSDPSLNLESIDKTGATTTSIKLPESQQTTV